MWDNFFKAGGWGMYPTALFGFLLVAAGIVLVLRPERRFVWLAVTLGVATLGSGLLSTSVGVVTSFHYIWQVAPDKQVAIAAAGCAESLHNLVLALMIVVFTSLLAAVAALRAAFGRGAGAVPGAPA